MKAAVIIATHGRVPMMKTNIKCLQNQTHIPEIVIACSDKAEAITYGRMGACVSITKNDPLGHKWQVAINTARKLNPDLVIICGSDDILQKDYVRRCVEWMERGFHFIGLQQWYVYDLEKLYNFRYMASIPLGGGRAYSKRFLDSINWQLFQSAPSNLDNYGFEKVRKANVKRVVFYDPHILSIKGPWPTLNPMKKFWGHQNVRLLGEVDKNIMEAEFNYDPKTILQELPGGR